MATDNTILNPGSGGDTIRTLDRTGTGSPKTEVVQLDLGGSDPNAENLIKAGSQVTANSVPVAIATDQVSVPIRLDDRELPIDDNNVPFVSLHPDSDPPSGTLQQQLLNSLNKLGAGLPPFSSMSALALGNITASGQNTPAVPLSGAAQLIVLASGAFTNVSVTFNGSYDGNTWFVLPTWGQIAQYHPGGATGLLTAGFYSVVSTAGFNYFRVSSTSFTSGQAILTGLLSAYPLFPLTLTSIFGNTGANLDAANGSAVPTNGLLVGGGSVAGATNFTALTVKAASAAAAATDTSLVVQPLIKNAVMSTAASGTQLVGISGATAVTLDAASNGTFPTNVLAVGVQGQSANPANVTTGRTVSAMADLAGRQIVTPVNQRTLVKSTATTISATGATAIVAAQGAGVFADIVGICITTAGAAAQTITISDGTLSWIIDYPNAAVAPGTPFIMTFDVPLSATTANTAWTANQSVATACHYLVNFANRLG